MKQTEKSLKFNFIHQTPAQNNIKNYFQVIVLFQKALLCTVHVQSDLHNYVLLLSTYFSHLKLR